MRRNKTACYTGVFQFGDNVQIRENRAETLQRILKRTDFLLQELFYPLISQSDVVFFAVASISGGRDSHCSGIGRFHWRAKRYQGNDSEVLMCCCAFQSVMDFKTVRRFTLTGRETFYSPFVGQRNPPP
jgi:hypothetical protein